MFWGWERMGKVEMNIDLSKQNMKEKIEQLHHKRKNGAFHSDVYMYMNNHKYVLYIYLHIYNIYIYIYIC